MRRDETEKSLGGIDVYVEGLYAPSGPALKNSGCAGAHPPTSDGSRVPVPRVPTAQSSSFSPPAAG